MAIPRSMTRSSSICVVQAEDRPLLRDRSSSTNSGPVGTMGVAPLLALNKALCEADGRPFFVGGTTARTRRFSRTGGRRSSARWF